MLLFLVEFLLHSKKGSKIQAMLQGPALLRPHYEIIMRRDDGGISIPQFTVSQFSFFIGHRFPSGGNEIFPHIYRCTQVIINSSLFFLFNRPMLKCVFVLGSA